MTMRALSIAATGMKAQQTNVDVIANNIANVNTGGFKKQRAEFTDLFYQHLRRAGAEALQDTRFPTGIQLGAGVQLVATKRLFTQGDAIEGNELDIMIDGQGFFQLQTFDGRVAYTRNGSFNKDSEGRLVSNDGFLLEPEISLGTDSDIVSISISPLGVVETTDSQANISQVGTIQIATFTNPAGLEATGDSLFLETPASGQAIIGDPGSDGRGILRQNFIEASNVQVVDELVDLINAQRAFELNSNSIQTADEMLQVANNLRR